MEAAKKFFFYEGTLIGTSGNMPLVTGRLPLCSWVFLSAFGIAIQRFRRKKRKEPGKGRQ